MSKFQLYGILGELGKTMVNVKKKLTKNSEIFLESHIRACLK